MSPPAPADCRPLSQLVWPDDRHLIDPRWRTETVLGLAAAVRESGDLTRLPILADALEDAGCDSAFVLDHLRHCDRHHHACWAVSAVLMTPRPLRPPPAFVALDAAPPAVMTPYPPFPSVVPASPVEVGGPADSTPVGEPRYDPLTEMPRFRRDGLLTRFDNSAVTVARWLVRFLAFVIGAAAVATAVRYLYYG